MTANRRRWPHPKTLGGEFVTSSSMIELNWPGSYVGTRPARIEPCGLDVAKNPHGLALVFTPKVWDFSIESTRFSGFPN